MGSKSGAMSVRPPPLSKGSTALLVVDLQKCYYKEPVSTNFPNVEKVATKMLSHFRESGVQVVHVMQEDLPQVSPWLTWWDYLHPSTEDFHANLGVPIPLDCAKPAPEERVFIKNGFDGFHRTNLHDYLRTQKVDTLVVMGLITRACVLNTIMSAFNYGYRILVVRDACGDREIKVHNQVIETYNGYNCIVLTSEEIIKGHFVDS